MGQRKTPDAQAAKSGAQVVRDSVARGAGQAASVATDAAEAGLDRAAPKVQAAWEQFVKTSLPAVEAARAKGKDAAARAGVYLDNVYDKVVEDYLPRINKAVADAAQAAQSDEELSTRLRAAADASTRALAAPAAKAPRRHRARTTFVWTALSLALVGAGYLLWKRSQPVEDPWAEEYWSDLDKDETAPGGAEAKPEGAETGAPSASTAQASDEGKPSAKAPDAQKRKTRGNSDSGTQSSTESPSD